MPPQIVKAIITRLPTTIKLINDTLLSFTTIAFYYNDRGILATYDLSNLTDAPIRYTNNVMSIDGFEGSVVLVDDEPTMRSLLTREAERADVPFAVFEDAESAVAGIDDSVGAVLSDGLYGRWREVIAAATEAGIPSAVISGDPEIQEAVEKAGAMFLNKNEMELGFVETILERLVDVTGVDESEGAVQEALPTTPEVSEAGLGLVVAAAAEHVVAARELHMRPPANPGDLQAAAEDAKRRREANRHTEASLLTVSILDKVLPLGGQDSWRDVISRQAEDLARQRAGADES